MTKREEQYIRKLNDGLANLLKKVTDTDILDWDEKEEILNSMKDTIEWELRQITSDEE